MTVEDIKKRVAKRRAKDLAGFEEQYDEILEKRHEQYEVGLKTSFQQIHMNVQRELKAIYDELQDANGVPITQSPIEASKARNMSRRLAQLGELEAQLAAIMLIGDPVTVLRNDLAINYAESYYFGAYGLEQAARISIMVPLLTQAHVMGVLANPWLPDGNTYSDRIRANTGFLAKKMEVTLLEAVGNGWGWNQTARRISDVSGEGYNNAVRLARTERRRAAGQAQSHLYMQNADIMDSKRWNALLDLVTAPKDADNDGKLYDIAYDTPESPGRAGERIPNHPNCRCKWTPVLSALGVSKAERIAKDKDNKRTYTKARTYREYAKEQGFPDLDDRLARDNPKRYLRQGE